ncbi:hypothetical protein K439DRAFT_1621705 [Ramaria rubella]|nr:hypothetical protein K439DRAFT_1621705 [Ramaria rubella]
MVYYTPHMVIFIDNLPHIQAAACVSVQTALASIWSSMPGLEWVKTELQLVKDGKMYDHVNRFWRGGTGCNARGLLCTHHGIVIHFESAVELLDAQPKLQVEPAEGNNTLKEGVLQESIRDGDYDL